VPQDGGHEAQHTYIRHPNSSTTFRTTINLSFLPLYFPEPPLLFASWPQLTASIRTSLATSFHGYGRTAHLLTWLKADSSQLDQHSRKDILNAALTCKAWYAWK